MAKTKMMEELCIIYPRLQNRQAALKQETGKFFKAVNANNMAIANASMDKFKDKYKKYDDGIDDMTKKTAALEAYMKKWDSDKHWKNKFKSSKKMKASKDLVDRHVKKNKELLQDLYKERDELENFMEYASALL